MKVKFGMMMTEASGKLGGHVAAKNRGGAYVRTKVTPSNPRTVNQLAARNRVTNNAQGWRGLTQTQRTAWNNAVSNFKSTDIFGDIRNPSGINLYVKLNSNLSEAGQSLLTVPPLPGAVTGPATLTLTAAAGTPALSLAFTVSPVPTGMSWIIRATAQQSPGKSFVKSLYRDLVVEAAAATSPFNLLSAYNTKFGTLVAGQAIFVEVIAVNNTTGQKSTPLAAQCIIAA